MIQSTCFVRTICCVLLKHTQRTDVSRLLRSTSLFSSRTYSPHGLCYDDDDVDAIKNRSKLPIKNTLLHNLRDIYQCSEKDVESLIKHFKGSAHLRSDNIVSNAKCLKENGLHIHNLVSDPWVLGYSSHLLPPAVELLKSLHHDVNVSLPLLVLPYKKLLHVCLQVREESEKLHENKLKWLSEIFEIDEIELVKTVAKRHFLLVIPHDRILLIMDILKGAGISEQHVWKDLSIFRHNPNIMKERCAFAKEAGVTLIKPWSLRCAESTFHRMIERKVKTREILGDIKSTRDYLSARLECGEEIVSYIFKKIPQLKHISVVKVKELLDYLYNVGYSPKEVCQASRILTRSVNTVRSRFLELQDLGLNHPNLLMLCKTRKEYKEFITKIKHDSL